MSIVEGIGDDLIYAFSFIIFIGIISLAWLSSHVHQIYAPPTLFIIERRSHRRNDQQLEGDDPTPPPTSSSSLNEQVPTPSSPSVNEISTQHESDTESLSNDELIPEQTSESIESNVCQVPQYESNNDINSDESISQTTTIEREDQQLRITIKFLNETQKSITAHSNDTISKIKRLYFADELASNKIVRFIYQGRELKDPETLHQNNIRDQTTIHCQISTRGVSTTNRINDEISTAHTNTNGFDTLSMLDTSPINVSSYFILILTLMLGLIWYLRVKYRILFTPISTIILILITVMLLIFTCGLILTRHRQVSDTRIPAPVQHVHLD